MLGSVFGRALFEQRRALLGWSLGTAALVLVTVAYYPSIRDNPQLNSFYKSLPPAVQALSGGVGINFASATGYLTTKLFAITVPIIFIIYGVLLGAGAVGREEDRGTAELLLTAPITRRRVIAEKALAAAALLAAVGVALFASLLLGNVLVDMHISAANLLAASIASILIGTTFGSVALAISGALGHRAHPAAWAGSLARRRRLPPLLAGAGRPQPGYLAEGLCLLLVPGLRPGRERVQPRPSGGARRSELRTDDRRRRSLRPPRRRELGPRRRFGVSQESD